MTNSYFIGQVVRVTGTFQNTSGVATDPTTVTFKWRDPVTAAITPLVYSVDNALVKDSTGVYHVDITTSNPGDLWFAWYGTGTVAAAIESVFIVKATRLS
jgi:hypothetical protein